MTSINFSPLIEHWEIFQLIELIRQTDLGQNDLLVVGIRDDLSIIYSSLNFTTVKREVLTVAYLGNKHAEFDSALRSFTSKDVTNSIVEIFIKKL